MDKWVSACGSSKNSAENTSFTSGSGFCSDCGSLLPRPGDKGGVTCWTCKREWGIEGLL